MPLFRSVKYANSADRLRAERMKLKGKTALITGASSGIGRATALEMARRGAHLVLVARNAEALGQTAAECAAAGVLATPEIADVTNREQCFALFERHRNIDVLVNNAGFAIFDSVVDARETDLRAMMETNYFGAVHCTQAALPQMLERRSGTIVNVASIAGIMGYARMSGYCATKFALTGFTEALRDEVLPRGVRVALVCPATTKTAFFVTADRRKMPAASRLMPAVTAGRVARVVCDAAESGSYRRIVPSAAGIYMRFKELTPRLAHALMRAVSARLERG